MQLDRTHVAIRVRTLSEIGDLSLVMIRRYPKAFFQAFFVGAAFWLIADLLLLAWLPLQPVENLPFESDFSSERFRYFMWMTTLVFLQAPIAGALTTYMLGQSIFEQQIPLHKAIREVRPVVWQLIRVLGLRRLAIPAMLFVAFRWSTQTNAFYDFFVPVGLMVIAAVTRSSRPFVAEMILLERCPMRSKNPDVITLGKRAKALHSPLASELGGRFITVSMTLSVLLVCIFFALLWTRGMAFGNWSADAFAWLVFFPLALWLIAALSVVVRLLGYLDARIRLEGWEVELAIRAEAIRQFGEDAMSTVLKPTTSTDQAALSAPSMPAPSPPGTATAVGTASATMRSLAILLTCGLSFVVCVARLSAQDLAGGKIIAPAATETPVVADSSWFDSEHQKLRSIELSDDRVDNKNRESRWLAKPPKPKTAPSPTPTKQTTPSAWRSFGIGHVIGWSMLVIIVCGMVALLMYVFANSSFDFRSDSLEPELIGGRALDEQTKQRIAELPAELRNTNVSPRAELQRWIEREDFDQAIVFLYGHQLLMLDRVGWLRLSRWKTNNQYVRETRQSEQSVGDQLRDTVEAFERSYFGNHALSAAQFERLWQANLAMEATVAATGGPK